MGIGVLRAGALFALASAGALLASPMGSNAPDWCSLAGQFDTWSEWRGPGKTTCSLILAQVQRRGERAGSISARHSFRTLERKVCGQELRLVLFCSSHESSGPKLLAVQLPHGCLRTRCGARPGARRFHARTANLATLRPASAAFLRVQRPKAWMAARRKQPSTRLHRRSRPALT